MSFLLLCSKPANLEGLEVDQYIWSILQNQRTSECDEVTIDQHANMKPCITVKVNRLSRLVVNIQDSLSEPWSLDMGSNPGFI